MRMKTKALLDSFPMQFVSVFYFLFQMKEQLKAPTNILMI